MLTLSTYLSFTGIALVMALSPGPNMIYLVSRSICQGRRAGLISLAGVSAGFFFYMICTALGVMSIFITYPLLFELLKIAGACYLFYLAWKALRPGGRSPLQIKNLKIDSPSRLFKMGFFTNLLNPKIAIMYLSLLPQFIHPEAGSVMLQFLILGMIQISIGTIINGIIAMSASSVSSFLTFKPSWLIEHRSISFEKIIAALDSKGPIDVIEHYNTDQYAHQKIYVVEIANYVYLVPFVEEKNDTVFLKTVFPSRKATKEYLAKRGV